MTAPVAFTSRGSRASRQAKAAWRALGAFVLVAVLSLLLSTVALSQATGTTVRVENRAYLTYTDENGAPGADTAHNVIYVFRAAELAQLTITKTLVGTDSVGVGDLVTYRLVATNTAATAAALDVVVTDSLPTGLTFVSADAPSEVLGRIVRFPVGALAAGQSVTITVTLRATAVAPAGVTNRAGASAGNATTVAVASLPLRIAGRRPAVLALAKTALVLDVATGEAVPYVLTLRNRGATMLAGVVVRDALPAGMRYVASSLSGADSVRMGGAAGRDLLFHVGDLAPDAERIVRYAAVAVSPGKAKAFTNTAVAATADGAVTSDTVRARVRVRGGFAVQGRTLVGKVWVDRNDDGRQQPGEEGVAGAEIWSADGQLVVTDKEGRFSLRDVMPGTHALRLDTLVNLPKGFGLQSVNEEVAVVRTDGWTTPRVDFRLVPRAAEPCPDSTSLDATVTGRPAAAPVVLPATIAPLQTPALRAAERERAAMITGPGISIFAPLDGAVIASNRLYVGVRGEAGKPVTLFDGDREIASGVLRPDGSYDFVGIEIEPGPHRLRVRTRNSWNQERWDSVATHRSGPAAKLVADPLASLPFALVMDDTAAATLRIRVLDRWDVPVATTPDVTVEATGARVQGEDRDEGSVGEQRRTLADGWLPLSLRAGGKVGDARLVLKMGGGPTLQLPLRILPTRRAIGAVGAGQVGIGASPASFGAVTARGAIGHDVSLSLSYDSRRGNSDELFARDFDPLGEARYPTLGDGSERRVFSGATQKFSARVERGLDWIELGDVTGKASSDDAALLAGYQRSLSGVSGQATTGMVTWRGFGSVTRQALRQQQLRGDGGSGPYVFGAGARPGTDRVVIEIRDRDNAARVISTQTLVRFSDYEIDYSTGAVLLRRPVPATDPSGNPVFLVATMERRDGGDEHFVGGMRMESDFRRWMPKGALDSLVLGLALVRDGSAASAAAGSAGTAALSGLVGSDVRLRMDQVTLGAEVLRGQSPDSTGVAGRATARWATKGDRASLGASWMRVQRGFAGTFDPRLASGLTDLRVDGALRLTEVARLKLGHERQRFAMQGVGRHVTTLRAEERLGGRGVSQELAVSGASVLDGDGSDANLPTAVTAKATVAVSSRMDVWVEGTRSFAGVRNVATTGADSAVSALPAVAARPDQVGVGASYRIFPGLRAVGTHRMASVASLTGGESARYAVTNVDLRAETVLGGEAWGGIERAGATSSSHAATLGWNQRLAMGGGWQLTSLFERRVGLSKAPLVDPTRALPFAQLEGNRWSASGGVEWLPTSDKSRLSLRAEMRDGQERKGQRVVLAGDAPLGQGAALITLHDWAGYTIGGAGATGQRSRQDRSLVGLALRPVSSDRINVLAKVEWRHSLDALGGAAGASSVLANAGDDRRLLGATDVIWAPAPRSELSFRWATRWTLSDAFVQPGDAPVLGVHAQYVGTRVERGFDKSNRVRLRLDGRLLHEQASRATEWSAAPSLLVRIDSRFEVEGGWRTGGLQDRDFAANGGRGFFATFGVRFTEKSLATPAAFWRDRLAGER